MAKKSASKAQQVQATSTEAVGEVQAQAAGAQFEWHYGRLTRMGSHDVSGRSVTIVWEEGGVSSQQGNISDDQWKVFELAFLTTGRIAVLSDSEGDGWMYDYRFLEAVR